MSRNASSVAGVMLSTIVRGHTTSDSIQLASAGSEEPANAINARCSTAPLSGRLSQLNTAKGGTSCARRRRKPSTIQPMVLRGFARIREIVRDVRVGRIEPILRVEAVTLFRNGQRHDARVARGEARERRALYLLTQPAASRMEPMTRARGAAPSSTSV